MEFNFNGCTSDEIEANYSIFYGMYVGCLFEYHCKLVEDPEYDYPLMCFLSKNIVTQLKLELEKKGKNTIDIEREVDKNCDRIFRKNNWEDLEIILQNFKNDLLK